ncbi:MAG: precorrin-6y C5,15-methyltransferase (decarboxylating) subunit CbiE [Bacillota bacterium]|uniref:precorrin-6y C5,15-methyltransferase (decarboxylating) subunit CbiE n=1 Tax=Desulfurispora thermophila TaxID=265470 RepID=UPI000361D57C|nr:precorrin-6y C5,15-methyltransferase (decarboxylating) subunit CbiE [Desulfurispora thermophila]
MVKITVVGVGPGSADYISPLAMSCIERADVLVGGRRHLEALARPEQETYPLTADLSGLPAYLRRQAGRRVVVLATGDPGLYGILTFLRQHFTAEQLQVIPGVSAVQLAFARLAMPWQDALICSVHGRDINDAVLDQLKQARKAAVLTGPACPPRQLARALTHIMPRATVYLCCDLSLPGERVMMLTVGELAQLGEEITSNCVMVIINE